MTIGSFLKKLTHVLAQGGWVFFFIYFFSQNAMAQKWLEYKAMSNILVEIDRDGRLTIGNFSKKLPSEVLSKLQLLIEPISQKMNTPEKALRRVPFGISDGNFTLTYFKLWKRGKDTPSTLAELVKKMAPLVTDGKIQFQTFLTGQWTPSEEFKVALAEIENVIKTFAPRIIQQPELGISLSKVLTDSSIGHFSSVQGHFDLDYHNRLDWRLFDINELQASFAPKAEQGLRPPWVLSTTQASGGGHKWRLITREHSVDLYIESYSPMDNGKMVFTLGGYDEVQDDEVSVRILIDLFDYTAQIDRSVNLKLDHVREKTHLHIASLPKRFEGLTPIYLDVVPREVKLISTKEGVPDELNAERDYLTWWKNHQQQISHSFSRVNEEENLQPGKHYSIPHFRKRLYGPQYLLASFLRSDRGSLYVPVSKGQRGYDTSRDCLDLIENFKSF